MAAQAPAMRISAKELGLAVGTMALGQAAAEAAAGWAFQKWRMNIAATGIAPGRGPAWNAFMRDFDMYFCSCSMARVM